MENVVEKSDYHYATEPYSVALKNASFFIAFATEDIVRFIVLFFFK